MLISFFFSFLLVYRILYACARFIVVNVIIYKNKKQQKPTIFIESRPIDKTKKTKETIEKKKILFP